jgi:hypothetical protein
MPTGRSSLSGLAAYIACALGATAAYAAAPVAEMERAGTALRVAEGGTQPLDLAGLEQRLRDTDAIGIFTKLTLQNQVDDLVGEFRAYHAGRSSETLDQLRQQYEVLLMKVISLLQDDDPQLAGEVYTSREAIWGVLTDPKQFATI